MTRLEQMQAERDKVLMRLTSLRKRVTAGDRTVEYDLGLAETALEQLDKEIRKASPSRRIGAISITPTSGY